MSVFRGSLLICRVGHGLSLQPGEGIDGGVGVSLVEEFLEFAHVPAHARQNRREALPDELTEISHQAAERAILVDEVFDDRAHVVECLILVSREQLDPGFEVTNLRSWLNGGRDGHGA